MKSREYTPFFILFLIQLYSGIVLYSSHGKFNTPAKAEWGHERDRC